MHNQSNTDSLSTLQCHGFSFPARVASSTTASSQGGGGWGQRLGLWVVWVKVSPGGGGSVASGVARDGGSVIVVEDALLDEGFDNGPMFKLPTNGVIKVHRDSANLMEEEEEDRNDVMAIS